jgi:hypothetical protein
MTLQEALQSGYKKFKRTYLNGQERKLDLNLDTGFNREDVLATDWEEYREEYKLTEDALREHWDAVASEFTSVKPSNTSPFFAKLLSRIKGE